MIDPTLFCGVLRNSADVGADYFWNVNKAFALVSEFGSMVNRRVFGFFFLLRSGATSLFKAPTRATKHAHKSTNSRTL
jgi:hypothetical protein